MDERARIQEMWSEFTGKNLELMSVWAEANQRVLIQWVEFASGAAQEGLRLHGELQARALEGARAVADGAFGPKTACHLAEANVQTLTQTAERLQANAEQVGKGIQATLTDAVSRTQDIYTRAA